MAGRDFKTGLFYHLPLIPLLFAFMAGLTAGRYSPLPWLFTAAWPAAALAGFMVLQRLIGQKPARVSPLVLFFALGAVAIAPWQSPFFPPSETKPLFDAGWVEISATVAQPPRVESFRTRCVLDQLKISVKDQKALYPGGRIQAAFYGSGLTLSPGDRLRFRTKLRPFQNFNNPGGFDYRQFMADKNIWATVYANARQVQKQPDAGKPGFRIQIHNLRDRLDADIADIDTDDAAAVLSALVVGKRHRISSRLQNAFNRAGVAHLLAISGLHMGIIATCGFLVLKWITTRFAVLLYSGRANKLAAMLTLMPVLCYALLSGLSPSTQRAVVMIALFLTAIVRAGPYHPVNTLAVAAFVICIVYPPSIFSVSFQLSFTAVTAIFFGMDLFFRSAAEPSANPDFWVFRRIGRFMLISVFAIAGTLPLVMHHFQQASVLGVAANLIMVPWIGFAAVPLGLIGAMIYPVSQTAGGWVLAGAHQILEPAVSLIKLISQSPVGAFDTFSPTVVEVICAYSLLACAGLIWRARTKEIRKAAALMLIPVLLVSAADAGYWIHRRLLHSDLRITVLDVGQGHASLVEFPRGHTMLIDGGGFSDNTLFDVGARILAPFLRQRKIGSIDTVVLSHPDADHLNGLLYILKHFKINEVITTGLSADTRGYKKFQKILMQQQIPQPSLNRINASRPINGAWFDILFPLPDAATACAPCSGANNCGLVVRVRYQGKSVLFPGDIEACAEDLVVKKAGARARADILIAPHHGSKTSSTQGFLEAVTPETVIIPVRQGRYPMPSPSVLDRYETAGIRIFRTDIHGAVRIRIRDKALGIQANQKTRSPH